MRLLDLFCGAGGAAMGYHRAGFEVVGVDINPQPHYPFEFHQADAFEYLAEHGCEFDAIHASPPCQKYTHAGMQWRKTGKEYPDLVAPVRESLVAAGKPYVIENVPGSPLRNPHMLNGAKFKMNVMRDRFFECSFIIPFELLPEHSGKVARLGRYPYPGQAIYPVGHFSGVDYLREQMGIDWMTRDELAQAIPPAYTEFIGHHLMNALGVTV